MDPTYQISQHFWISSGTSIACPTCGRRQSLRRWDIPGGRLVLCYACGTLIGLDPVTRLAQFTSSQSGWGAEALALTLACALQRRAIAINVNRP